MNINLKALYAHVVSRMSNNAQLNDARNQAIERWQQLSARERVLVGGGSIFLVLILFYTLLWEPLSSAVYQYRENVISNKQLLFQLQQAGPEINALRSQVKRSQINDQAELLSVIERLVRKSRLQASVSEIGLGPQSTVQMRFDDVPFDDLMSWLIDLQQKEGIVVQTFILEKLPTVGHVKVQMTVSAV